MFFFHLKMKVLTASALSGLRWTLAQILTQKEDLGMVLVNMYICIDHKNLLVVYNFLIVG